MVKKHQIAVLLNTGTSESAAWKRIKKSTALTIALNPETVDYDYISDESPTTEVDKYKPVINQPLTMYEDEDDFKYIWDKFYELKTGSDAHSEVMIVFMFDGNNTDGYKAWKADCAISCNEMNAVDKTITFDILFGGTVTKGTATTTGTAPDLVPTFTAAT